MCKYRRFYQKICWRLWCQEEEVEITALMLLTIFPGNFREWGGVKPGFKNCVPH
jgi:hypothetical protein